MVQNHGEQFCVWHEFDQLDLSRRRRLVMQIDVHGTLADLRPAVVSPKEMLKQTTKQSTTREYAHKFHHPTRHTKISMVPVPNRFEVPGTNLTLYL